MGQSVVLEESHQAYFHRIAAYGKARAMHRFDENDWALILGGSSGMGLAAAKKLARHGMGIVVLHRDLRGAMGRVEEEFAAIREAGGRLAALNTNALDEPGRARGLAFLAETLGSEGRVKLLLHSIAQGNLKRAIAPPAVPEPELTPDDFAATLDAMGTSLFTWAQGVHRAGRFAADARIVSLTSEGSRLALPGYAAVGAAKAALEAISRSLALELAPYGVRCNVIQAGVTDTPALARIPGAQRLKEQARARNPYGRLTTPEDVARAIYLLCLPEADWINGAILRVDGGESITLPV